jgi:hypothetical protein
VQAVPITVSGVDALGQPFKERTTTVMVNCHGCKYQSKHYVPKNSIVTLEIPRMEPGVPPRIVPGHVVWVQRPRTVRELFQIGLEFEAAGNVWGIAFPPEDWVPSAEDEAAANAAPSEIEVIVETKPVAAPPKAPTPSRSHRRSQPPRPDRFLRRRRCGRRRHQHLARHRPFQRPFQRALRPPLQWLALPHPLHRRNRRRRQLLWLLLPRFPPPRRPATRRFT